jgi:hypothetical protein
MDMAMRSSGIMALTSENNVIGFEVIKTRLEDFPDHEDMIIHVVRETIRFITEFEGDFFVIEGLAHGAKNASFDVIAGLFWSIRCAIWKHFIELPIGIVPVTSWRSKVLNKEDRAYAKENYSPKADVMKIATVKKLPLELYEWFTAYVECSGFNKKSIYDLADAYFLGVYRNSL